MTVSDKQKKANKKNSKKSTGPITLTGKSAVSVNAVKHGILSKKLILPHENSNEFDVLLDEMTLSLKPVGTMEKILVEKISINLWRQRRLTNAESAQLSLQTLPEKITQSLLIEHLDAEYLMKAENKSGDQSDNSEVYYIELQKELEYLDIDSVTSYQALQETSPVVFITIEQHARAKNVSVDEFISQQWNGLSEYLRDLLKVSIEEVERLKRISTKNSLLPIIREWVRAKNAITKGEMEKQFSRYQTSLDNELYKALKALREQQQWRRDNIEGEIID